MANERIQPVDEIQLLRAAACDWRLSRGDVAVFAVILKHCNADRGAHPGPTRIAKEANLAITNVKASVLKLERYRYVTVERPGLRKCNRFVVNDSPRVPTRRAHMPSHFETTGRVHAPSSSDSTRDAGVRSTGDVGTQKLGMLARHEVALKAPLRNHSASRPLVEEEEREAEKLEQLRLQREERRAQDAVRTREGFRAEYLQARSTHPAWARKMESQPEVRKHIADLIDVEAA